MCPLLFITVLEQIFTQTSKAIPEACIRAYTDDVALVAHFGVAQNRALAKEYTAFGKVSGLTLNIPKSVAMPLRREPLLQAANHIREANVGWET